MGTLLRDYGNRLVVRLLQLEMISRQENPDAEAYQSILDIICTTIHLTEPNISMILHFVHQLRQHSNGLACRTLKSFLLQRLLPHENAEWTAKSFITLLWMSTTGTLAKLSPLEIGHLFDVVLAKEKGLGSEVTQGALVLLWKRIEDNFNSGKFDETIKWCQLARHKLLERSTQANVDKIERKLVQCYLEIFDLEACKAHVSQLLESKDQHPLNHYLAFCVALRAKDEDSARKALLARVGSGAETDQLLCACISKTLASGTPEQAANILLVLLDTSDFDPPPNMSLPALLRCIIGLHLIRLDDEQEPDVSLRERVVGLFSSVPEVLNRQKAASSRVAPQCATSTPSGECAAMDTTWFIVNCYQLAIKHASDWPPTTVISLLESVIRIIEHRPEDSASINDGAALEDHLRKCLSYFAITVIRVVEGRRRSWLDDKIAEYSKADESATHFGTCFEMYQQHTTGLGGDDHGDATRPERLQDLASKRDAILPLQLEAAIYQSLNAEPPASKTEVDPSRLCDIIAKAQQLSAPRKVFALFADVVLSATSIESPATGKKNDGYLPTTPSLPIKTASTLLVQVIATMRTFPDYDTACASRWIRCLVQLGLDQQRQLSYPCDPQVLTGAAANVNDEQPLNMVEDLVHQAIVLTRQHQSLQHETKSDIAALAQKGRNEHTSYPAEELEWLSTTLFNLGVDFYILFSSGGREGGGEASLNCGSDDRSESDNEVQARKWTSLAVEVADVLAQDAGGDQGLLARVLRRKMREGIGWVV